MADLDHIYGQDLKLSATGGLLVMASGTQQVQQRVIRRLLTCYGDAFYAPENWAGLPTFIGQIARDRRIRAVTIKAMRAEAGVDQTKPIVVTVFVDPATNTVMVKVQYTDKITADTSEITLPLKK